jgi:hypothetical protein
MMKSRALDSAQQWLGGILIFGIRESGFDDHVPGCSHYGFKYKV